jgi:hypothetical protein
MDLNENRGWELNVVTGIFLGLSWFSVLTRCYVRTVITKSFEIDDWCMLVAIVSYVELALVSKY